MKAETKRAVALILLVCHWGTLLHSQAPEWWAARQARNPVLAPDDYALINQGQLKHLAHAAYLEMEERLPGGAGTQITALVQSWLAPGAAGRDDYAVSNLGQLKAVAALFHTRLQEEGVAVPYTWTAATTDDDDFAPANIGQAKALFAFSILAGMVGGATSSESEGQASATQTDSDNDGISDMDEARFGLNGTEGDDALTSSQIFHPDLLGRLEAVSAMAAHAYVMDAESNIISATP